MSEEIELYAYMGKNYSRLKDAIEQQFQKDMHVLELAHDNQMKELLKDYPKAEDLAMKYVEIIAKKSRLAHHKRELILEMFEPIVKNTAISIINQKEPENNKKEETPCSSEKQPAKPIS